MTVGWETGKRINPPDVNTAPRISCPPIPIIQHRNASSSVPHFPVDAISLVLKGVDFSPRISLLSWDVKKSVSLLSEPALKQGRSSVFESTEALQLAGLLRSALAPSSTHSRGGEHSLFQYPSSCRWWKRVFRHPVLWWILWVYQQTHVLYFNKALCFWRSDQRLVCLHAL